MNGNGEHPWILVAPWYRWPRPGEAPYGRLTAPALEKFAAPTFVNDFLKEPQRSLLYADEDFVHTVELKSPRPKRSLSSLVRVKTGRRKVFLDTHGRFYLVVCELHCDEPGLPMVARDKVCEAGLVVRRRVAPAPPAARKALSAALAETTALEARVAGLRGVVPTTRGGRAIGSIGSVLTSALAKSGADEISSAEADLAASRAALQSLASFYGVALELQGWVPSEHKGIGAWRQVPETPREIVEEIFPLYPLIPDPAIRDHSARGRTIYFGVLPAGSSDLDEQGNPRFEDRSLYEVRCFVRRHKPCCPKTGQRGDCPGPLVWSRPTEVYQLAAAMDLDGTSHKPVTIQLPDLPALEAQAAAMKVGEGVGVRMVAPAKSSLEFKTDADGKPINGSVGGAAICSFSIPLITIIATFVLKLFLPIVVLLFGLWWMLKLKFCIPPSFELDAGLSAALSATPPGVDFSAGLSVDIDASLKLNLGDEAAAGIEADYGGDVNVLGELVLEMGSDYSQDAPADLAADFDPPKPGFGGPRLPLPSLGAGLAYHERVEVPA